MSTSSEFEPAARQDYGPTTSSKSVYESVLDHKLTDMSVSSVRTPVLRAVPLSPTQGDPEPDSTNPESIIQAVDKEIAYHITEKRCDNELSVDTISGLVRIEEAGIDSVSRISYPIIQEVDDSGEGNYVENSATLIQAPLNTAIVQNVTKLPQNFTFNVDAAVSNIATLQNVSQDLSGSQTLWLPTILATSAPPIENKNDDERPQGVSQIIITSENYTNDTNQPGRRANLLPEASFLSRPKTSKVQILSNISIPKPPTYTQQYITQNREVATSIYTTQNHVYKLNTNILPQKHLSNSVLTKPAKTQSLIGCSTLSSGVINNSPTKNTSYSHSFNKVTNANRTPNKVNNGANMNAMISASSGSTQCHILSRVVSGPNKMSVHSGKKTGSIKGSKSSQSSSQKNQSRPIKIIQQTGTTQKSEGKTWPLASVTYKSHQTTPKTVDSNSSKIIQKVGSPTNKSLSMSLPKYSGKSEHLVLQSPCGPVLISTAQISTNLSKAPHYVQSGATPNLRYVQTYGLAENQSTISQVSANQQLTAQILQSLSQPKLLLQQSPSPTTNNLADLTPTVTIEEPLEMKPVNQKRIVFGDKSTLLTADDIIGMEERPNLSEELCRYSFQPLAFIMLDHTYALPVQKQPTTTSAPTTPISTTPPPVIASPPIATSPMSPLKRNSPVIMSTASYDLPITVPTSVAGSPIPVSTIQMSPVSMKPQSAPPQDDDTASVISSIDEDRKQANQGGSDTETAPEGEEEGKTRCICDFTHDDGYMICCDRCGEWQHVDCMGIDRQNIPDAYMCELCQPRSIDRRHARAIQMRKREELSALGASDSDSSECSRLPGVRRKRLLTVTTYTNTSGSSVTTYNSTLPVLPPLPQPTLTLPKRGPKRPKKTEIVRKGTKRKLSEKRVKRKKEMLLNRNKYNSSLTNQSHWQDSYELAVTNHYSPELRAKILKYSSKLGSSANMAYAMNAHLCTTVPHAGGKILIATKDLKENTPVIELRGKYMLSNQHRPQIQNSARAGSQKPGPFVFFYKLPKDNIQICIDTRTYGNEARFVRRSCKPNAELQHCIVKGTLHVYLVTIGVIQLNTEITVGHDTEGSKQPCACGNPKHCKVNGLNTLASRKSVDYPQREKRSRNRCFSSSSPVSPPLASVLTPIKDISPQIAPVKSEKKSPIKHEYPPLSPVKSAILALDFDKPIKLETFEDVKPEIDLIAKEEMKPEDLDEPDFVSVKTEEEAQIKVKEEVIQPEPEVIPEPPIPLKVEEPKEPEIKAENEDFSDEEKQGQNEEIIQQDEEITKLEDDKPLLKDITAKSACHDRSARSSRTACVNQDSMDDKTDDSQDKMPTKIKDKDKRKMTREERKMEAIMKAFERMEKAEQRKQEVKERQKRRESDPHPNSFDKDDDDEILCASKKRKKRKGRARTSSQSNRRRLNSADSDLLTSGDEAPCDAAPSPRPSQHVPSILRQNTSLTSGLTHSEHEKSCEGVSEDLGLSSACLLVEAAVGSVESAFKLPKTKKTIATEWIGRSPERTPPYCSSYTPSLVSTPSLESLVRVASTIIGDLSAGHDIEDETRSSPPRTPGRERNRPPKKAKRVTRSTPPAEVPEIVPMTVPQHSAKKRWLRQAISEESDSPLAESPPNEMVTPLKKRRLARQSLSCDQITPVPCNEEASPVLTSEDSPVKDDPNSALRQYKVRNIMDSIYGCRDRTRSDSGQGSDDQCNMDNDVLNVNIKGPHDSENIRRIIGIPTPEDECPPDIMKPDDKSNNNNVELEESNNKVVPMEIDTTILHPKIQESVENVSEVKRIDSPNEKLHSCQSADTSGNSSPQRDEMDDIQKKIHSFHTENIQILKIRNRKLKEKRKKVNLNFDLNMVDDQISVQLRTESDISPTQPEMNGDINEEVNNPVSEDVKFHISPQNIPLPPIDSIPLPAPENIPLPEEPSPVTIIPAPETIPLPEEPMLSSQPLRTASPVEKEETSYSNDRPSVLDSPKLPFSSRFSSTGLFSGIFSNMSQSFNIDNKTTEDVPNMSIIKSAIDRTTSLDNSIFEKDSITPVDDLKSVQEILTRVNNMDSNSSVILSGVLQSSKCELLATESPVKQASKQNAARTSDPRLNPPPAEKPKPVRRKLSISEYRKRLKGPLSEDTNSGGSSAGGTCGAGCAGGDPGPEWSSSSSASGELSPQRLDAAAAAAADELEQRLHKVLVTDHLPKGVFDAQPTASERQRENLSSRLRREFGLALPDDDESRPPTEASDGGGTANRCER